MLSDGKRLKPKFESESVSRSVMSNSVQPHGLSQTTRLLYPWNSPGKNTGVGCHFLLQGSSQPRDQTHVSCDSCPGRQVLYHDASQETLGTHFPLAYKSPGRKVLRRAVVINPMRGKSSRRLPVSRESPSIAEPPLQPAPSPGAAEDARLRSGCLRC